MATAAELIQTAGEAREAFKAAVATAADRWETASEGEDAEWTPRHIAEHAIGAERRFAGMMAEGVGQSAPTPEELSLASAEEAAAAFDASSEAVGAVVQAVSEENIGAAASMPEGAPFDKTVAGVLNLVTWHYQDHTGQISKV
ncbi:MAG: DinB family protein [Chloroflexi bacterium]|nr:DinB family protein [Chloroflexota bacterium]